MPSCLPNYVTDKITAHAELATELLTRMIWACTNLKADTGDQYELLLQSLERSLTNCLPLLACLLLTKPQYIYTHIYRSEMDRAKARAIH